MAEIASLWIGDKLGPIEVASAKSFLRHGDQLTIYSYNRVENVPEQVTLRDAREIMPLDEIIYHRKTKSPAIHADLFRYALISKTTKTWVDLDIIALRPFDFQNEWIFGLEAPRLANTAVLRLPHTSLTLEKLLTLGPDTRGLPPTLTGLRRLKYWLKSPINGLAIDRWPWGATGPRIFTHFLEMTGEIRHALPQSSFYSIPIEQISRFLEPNAISKDMFPFDTWGVHLWAKELRKIIDHKYCGSIPDNSFVARALAGSPI